ncbi:MAG: GntR family transcriptional regulator [Candidatus Aminicenantes bacterium]|nr:GntR family transcriptional regulator [Candidatus Aminicenantes bacterium]
MKFLIVISPSNPDPMYKQVTDQIKDAIATGNLVPETKLPSIRDMANELKISAITIKRAYSDLENEGYIFTRSGLGSYVADINKEKMRNEKIEEIRNEVHKIRRTAEKFGISADDIIHIIKESGD